MAKQYFQKAMTRYGAQIQSNLLSEATAKAFAQRLEHLGIPVSIEPLPGTSQHSVVATVVGKDPALAVVREFDKAGIRIHHTRRNYPDISFFKKNAGLLPDQHQQLYHQLRQLEFRMQKSEPRRAT